MVKLPNHRLVKVHRSYNVAEAAHRLEAHKNTVRRWIKDGLPTVGGPGETLILGAELFDFLAARRKLAKRPCPAGHMYCFKCRAPRPPAGGMADYAPMTPASGNLKALCPDCFTVMHRRVRESDLARLWPDLDVTRPHPQLDLSRLPPPSLNSDSQ